MFTLLFLWISLGLCRGAGWIEVDSRHQTSLSTFNTEGKLSQVEYATEAASMGTPVVAVCRPGIGLFLASPQALPSPFILDDGTARFAKVNPNLLVAHSGISADGRVLVAACQELAIQHEYIYDEDIPLDIFLEEMALLYQEYTMKPNARPFGSTLIVAYQSPFDDTENCFYRIDPSGGVKYLGKFAVINGGKLQQDGILLQQLQDISQAREQCTPKFISEQVLAALESALKRSSNLGTKIGRETKLPSLVRRIIIASLKTEGLILESHELPRTLTP